MTPAPQLVDSHCHLDDEQFAADQRAAIERALEAGVGRMVVVGTGDTAGEWDAVVRLAEQYDCIYASLGLHPHHAAAAEKNYLDRLREYLSHPKVVSVGEIGLDYHYDFSPRERQREVFAEQLQLASDAAKPVVIHTREAWEDTFALLAQHWPKHGPGGIMHCFSGGPDQARRSLAMGFHLSFAGILTYPKALDVQEAARMVPPERMLVETDAPYLAPVPKRGKRNEPALVVETARKLAELRHATLEEVAWATTSNWERLCLGTAGLRD
jgi:TatD DNase family protein